MLLLSFTAASKPFAVAGSRVVEVLPKLELRPIPHAPPLLAGLLRYRAKVVPVIDLGLLLGTAPCRNLLSTRMILVNDAASDHNQENVHSVQPVGHSQPAPSQSRALLGLVAENVNTLIYVQPEQICPVPVQVPDAPYLDALVKIDHELVPLIAVEKIRGYLLSGAFSNQGVLSNLPYVTRESMDPEQEEQTCER